jgi:hypothetical protein
MEYCLVNYGVVQLLVVSSISGWTTGVLMPLGMADTNNLRNDQLLHRGCTVRFTVTPQLMLLRATTPKARSFILPRATLPNRMCTPPRLLSTTPPRHLRLHNYVCCPKYYTKVPKYYSTKAPDYHTTIYAAPTYDTEAPAYYTTKAVEHSGAQVRWKSVEWASPPPNTVVQKFRTNFVSNSGTVKSEGELFILVIFSNMY